MRFASGMTKALEQMFHVLLSDLSSGMSEPGAGWISPDQLALEHTLQSGLISSGIMERNSKGEVRLNFKNYNTRQELKRTFALQSNQLDYFLNTKNNEIKVKKAQKTLNELVEIVQQSPSSWTYIVAIGWRLMLESSGMPALIDDVLSEGFSPEDWTIKAVRSSSEFALGVSQKIGQINEFDDAINFLMQIKIHIGDFTLPPSVDYDVQRVKKILKWMDIEKELTEPIIKTLGFSWFSFLVLDSANLFSGSNESNIKMYTVIWDAIEKLLGKNQSELLNNLEDIIRTLEVYGITWASDIIRMPEVM